MRDIDSVMKEKGNPTQREETEEKRAPETITPPDATQEMGTEIIHARRLPTERETKPEIKEDLSLVDYDRPQTYWGVSELLK